jgi:methylmalonyl-CoA mutase
MLRNTTEAFSGAMGGVDSMHVCPFDEPIRPADEFSRRVSRNLQIILQEEAHFVHPIDPAGGSWYIEKLADSVARKAWKLFQDVEAAGGMTQALLEGLPQAAVAARKAKNIDTRKDIKVGTNMYPNLKEIPLAAPNMDFKALQSKRAGQVQAYRLQSDLFKLYDQLGDFRIKIGGLQHGIRRRAGSGNRSEKWPMNLKRLKAAVPASWWSKWARTGMTEVPK